jgi:hypothetical protein
VTKSDNMALAEGGRELQARQTKTLHPPKKLCKQAAPSCLMPQAPTHTRSLTQQGQMATLHSTMTPQAGLLMQHSLRRLSSSLASPPFSLRVSAGVKPEVS